MKTCVWSEVISDGKYDATTDIRKRVNNETRKTHLPGVWESSSCHQCKYEMLFNCKGDDVNILSPRTVASSRQENSGARSGVVVVFASRCTVMIGRRGAKLGRVQQNRLLSLRDTVNPSSIQIGVRAGGNFLAMIFF